MKNNLQDRIKSVLLSREMEVDHDEMRGYDTGENLAQTVSSGVLTACNVNWKLYPRNDIVL